MKSALAETSDRYEKIEENVFRMKPIGTRTRRRILTPFGRGVILAFTVSLLLLGLAWLFLRR